nr:MAG TPA: hypothetical protein [Caudoviricetes sp.]
MTHNGYGRIDRKAKASDSSNQAMAQNVGCSWQLTIV